MKFTSDKQINLFDFIMYKLNLGSKTKGKKIIKYSNILVNGKAVNDQKYILEKGDEIILEREKTNIRKIDSKSPILYEDDYLIIANKPAGILTYGIGEDKYKSFYGIISTYINQNVKRMIQLYVVHRLDREVSGLLIFAKSESTQYQLKENWKNVEKLYYALVEKRPEKDFGTIESWLRDHNDKLTVISGIETPDSKFAITHYKVLKQIGDYFLLEVRLETGRKNQIRVHMADIGCPIVGDYRYGADKKFKRQVRLCAYSLKFPHPKSGKEISVQIKLTKSFLNPENNDEKYK
ncbi:MAG: hypothetical protein A2046_15060 [Bacteroidetes bacterium GWA2_30_7]|nr:MAG: hypothetical protein A2046_15060 [Bacteroidetes bacterium GWA2_30_7]